MREIRRIVTGHDESGKSIFLQDGAPPQLHHRTQGKVRFHEIWSTGQMPCAILPREPAEPNERLPLRIPPDPSGTIIRVLDIHPGHLDHIVPRDDGRHPGMHRTETIDYGIMLEGELTMLLDDSEVDLQPGDIVIQRGTNHAWENRSDSVVARIAFILVDGCFSGALAQQLAGADLMRSTIAQKADTASG